MADRYWIGNNGNWNSTMNWSTSSGGAGGASVPNNTSDKAIFDGNSPGNAIINTTGLAVFDLDMSNAPNGIQIILGANNFSVTRNLTLNANAIPPITNSGYSSILFAGGSSASAWAFAGGTLDVNFRVAGGGQKTMTGDITINGYVYWSATSNLVGSGYYMYVKNGWQGPSYFNDLATNPIVVIQGGAVSGTLPNSTNGCIINPTVSDITFAAGASATTLRETTYLIYTAGDYSIITTGNQTYAVTFAGKLKCSGIQFNSFFHVSGNPTLEEDLNVDYLDNNGATVEYKGDYSINVAKDWNLRGTNTISGAATIRFKGTGTFGSNTISTGSSYDGVVNININVVIDTEGTITGFANRAIYFGGSKSFILTNGTFVTTNTLYYVNGTYTFDVPALNFVEVTSIAYFTQNTTLTTLNINSGEVWAQNGLVVTTLRQTGSGVLYNPNNGTVLNITTNMYHIGTDTSAPSISANPITVPEFVASRDTSLSTNSSGVYYKRASTNSFNDVTDFTFAFDYIHTGYIGYNIIGGTDGYLWTPSNYSGSLFFFMTPSDAYYAFIGISTAKRRIVITKALGSAMKFYVDGVLKSTSVSGSSANLINADINFGEFVAAHLTGDVLFFNGTAKDATWVSNDYAAFQVNGNSSAGLYDNTETDLTAGWHVDSWTQDVTNTILKYDGTKENEKLFRSGFRYINATPSANRLWTWFGYINDSSNVSVATIPNIGGAGITITET